MKDHPTWMCSFCGLRDTFASPQKETLVTTRSSGDSFLNRVELQNGCLARGHSNLLFLRLSMGFPSVKMGNSVKNSTKRTWNSPYSNIFKRSMEFLV